MEEKEWIESPEGWEGLEKSNQDKENVDEEDGNYAVDLFAKTDSRQSFEFKFSRIDGEITKIKVSGYELYSDETAKSTGVTLWEGSMPLANYITKLQDDNKNNIINGQKVLELGAGLGLCGIVAHYLGAREVVLTDGDTNALQQMRKNVNINNCYKSSVSCQQLLWSSIAENDCSNDDSQLHQFKLVHDTFDVILASDVIYTPESIDPLFSTAKLLLGRDGGKFIMSWYTRVNQITLDMILQIAEEKKLVLVGEESTGKKDEGIYIFEHEE